MTKKLAGIIPPIVTPFDEDGEINEKKFEALLDFVLSAGVDGISVGGSTGEGPTLNDNELVKLIRIAKPMLKPDQPLVCGVMRTCTRDAVAAGLRACDAGADAVMVTPTAYNVLVPDEEGNFTFYKTVSEQVGMPVIIYNINFRT
jgi:4-hydroxy-tetrahydrodipicolinate synthase